MSDMTDGQRVAGFILLKDVDGKRHAVRPGAFQALSDADEDGDETIAQIGFSRQVRILRPLDEVLTWF
ncbi:MULTISPECIES: hypothetical protein [Alphaproteobacteria]|nr:MULTISPECIES: hypothetical protein [Rhodospirillales]KAA0686188.1 hypothetical protein DS837_10850 [Azospirillum brasilense]